MKKYLQKRLYSFYYAFKGIYYAIRTQYNMQIHIAMATVVIGFGLFFNITTTEWVSVIMCVGMVMAAELFNTAIEILLDWLSPEYHPQVGIVKDVAAGAVLCAAMCAAVVGAIIFLPKILRMF